MKFLTELLAWALVVLVCSVIATIGYHIGNLLADVVIALIDPRIRLE